MSEATCSEGRGPDVEAPASGDAGNERGDSLRASVRAEAPVLVPLAVAVFAATSYFSGPPAWNQNSRLALTRALVEQGTTIIDDYHATTGDKSQRDGHFYSDKAPGTSLLAAPAYALYYGAGRLVGADAPEVRLVPLDPRDPNRDPAARRPGDRLFYNQAYRTALYVSRVGSVGVFAVLGALALYLLALRRLGDRAGALLLAATYALATPALIYGSALYGHQLCADLLLLGFAGILLGHGRTAMAFGTGMCLGLAVLCEYPAAVPVALLWLFAWLRRGTRFAVVAALGGAPAAIALAIYHSVAFGGPLKTGYDFVYLAEFAEGMRVNYGIHAPDPGVLLELLFGAFRGLFYLAPVLLLAPWGLACELRGWPPGPWSRSSGTWPVRQVAAVCLGVIGFYLALNAGYYMWDGGAAIGPRHCVPMLPFLALALAPAIRAVPRAVLGLALLSGALTLLLAASAPEAPQFGDPLWGHAWPRIWATDTGYTGPANLGRMLGLPGPLSLVPLLLVLAWCYAQARPHLGARA
ncbi:hypothetical protein [Nannocystis bainbridge]|uniref:DUF2142 domain-containing protein n=1 Tax=Nannocystis bainbridge TaxID=2995303 RepID=A0ABT5DX52_9BACT|nr:hypothetical protein [Nannocystis bainbridge]MDC0717725.1 hypothetical protein [Nannocystis bainbridge]